MPFITVNRGGPEIPANFQPGAYIVVLADIADPKTVTAQRGPKAGQDIDLIDWTFNVFDGEFEGLSIEASTSTASGPKSKLYGYLTALFGGKAPTIGQQLEKNDLIGKLALATISVDDGGWMRIDNLSAIPASVMAGKVAQATGAPLAATPPVAVDAAGVAQPGNLPF
jgi:hypothetical protein